MRIYLLALLLTISTLAQAQNGIIRGRVFNPVNNEGLPLVRIELVDSNQVVATDLEGNYVFKELYPGTYSLNVKLVGYGATIIDEVLVTNAKYTQLDIPLKESNSELKEVEVSVSPFEVKKESPVSYRSLSASEIERYPGANRDVSKVIRALPGVAATASFRNDVVIRGGAPIENRFFLDGIEVPNINHFATQGSNGGPVGLLNVNFIKKVDFYSAAFPANRGNALSAVLEFTQKDGNKEKLETNFALGSSDVALTFDGPVGERSSFIFSARRSYLQFLFQALKLPFLPTYNDAQFKWKTRFNDKTELSVIGLGAIDQFRLNTSVNDGVEDQETLERNEYFLGNIPKQEQWNYTVGANLKRFTDNGFHTFVVSRNHLNNTSIKYQNNDDSDPSNLILDYVSEEIENKLRYEKTWFKEGLKLTYGAGYQYVTYTNSTFNKIFTNSGAFTVDFNSRLDFSRYSAFGQASYSTKDQKWDFSLGVRTDWADYSDQMNNPLNQISPRFSVAYNINKRWSVSANAGRYYQLPAYTILGFKDTTGEFANKFNDVSYMQADHLVAGISYLPFKNTRVSVEGFYKIYQNYPFSLSDSISLANLGADFGVIGNEPVSSTSNGRSYGVEFLVQQKLTNGFYGILAYTMVRSEFEDKNGNYIPSSWDSQHIVSLTGGKKFNRNWEVGVRWLFSGGLPYTPFDVATSSLISSWSVNGMGVLDYNRLNNLRLQNFHQLDIRVDKRWYFKNWSLNLYLDIQNVYGFATPAPPILTVERDGAGNPLVNNNDPSRYDIKFLNSSTGTVVPTLGIIAEF